MNQSNKMESAVFAPCHTAPLLIPIDVLRREQMNRIHDLHFGPGSPADKWRAAEAWLIVLNEQYAAYADISPRDTDGYRLDIGSRGFDGVHSLLYIQFWPLWEAVYQMYKVNGGTDEPALPAFKPVPRTGPLLHSWLEREAMRRAAL